MSVIAIAWGLGQVGRALVNGLVTHGGHKVYILSRSIKNSQGDVEHLQVDYDDVSGTSQVLEHAGVDTLVCAIGVLTPQANKAQLNLIQAANMSATTRRFIIRSYDLKHLKEHIETNPLARYTFEAIDALEKTNLEYTRVANGWFIDYFGMPHWESSIHPWINVLNMEKKWAVVPGDGTAVATFITTQDLGRFIDRLMELRQWPKVSSIVGNETSFNDLVAMAEAVRDSKFDVVHDSLEKLDLGHISFASQFPPAGLGDGDEAFLARIHYLAGSGNYRVLSQETLNDKFPDIKLTTVLEVMEKSWKGR